MMDWIARIGSAAGLGCVLLLGSNCAGPSLLEADRDEIAETARTSRDGAGTTSSSDVSVDRTTANPTEGRPDGNDDRDTTPGTGDAPAETDTADATTTGNAADGTGEPESLPALPSSQQERIDAIRDRLLAGDVPAIPLDQPSRIHMIHEDFVYAEINNSVITYRDLLDDQTRASILALDAQEEALPPWRVEQSEISGARRRPVLRRFQQEVLSALFEQEADSLRDRLGSIPQEQVDNAVLNQLRLEGLAGLDPRRRDEVLARRGQTLLELEARILQGLEASRVIQYYAFAPQDKLGVSFDVSPEEMRREYLRNPIVATTNVEILRLRLPAVRRSEEERARQEARADEFLREARSEFDAINRSGSITSEQAEARRQQQFRELVTSFTQAPATNTESLLTLDDQAPEVAAAVRRTSPGGLTSVIRLDEEVQVIYVVQKQQQGLAPFDSRAVQRELQQRLQNRRWNRLESQVYALLLERAVIRVRQAGLSVETE